MQYPVWYFFTKHWEALSYYTWKIFFIQFFHKIILCPQSTHVILSTTTNSSTVFPPSATQPTNLISYKETEIGVERILHSSEKEQEHQMHQKYWTTSTHIHVHEDTCQKFGKHFSFDSAVRSERVNLLWEKSQKLKMEAKSHPKLIGMPSIHPERFNSSCVLQSHH